MNWHLSFRADHGSRLVADRHYNRQHVGAPQFVPPGACVNPPLVFSGKSDPPGSSAQLQAGDVVVTFVAP